MTYSTDGPIPVHTGAADAVSMIASYDHVPEIQPLLREVDRILRPGGTLLVVMQNYGFWLKQLINRATGKKLFRHVQAHYRVHSPETLAEEVGAAVGFHVARVRADYSLLPNLPRRLSHALYRSERSVEVLHNLLATGFRYLPLKNSGSVMIVSFRKPA